MMPDGAHRAHGAHAAAATHGDAPSAAIVLAGGRGSRLGGVSKALMRVRGEASLRRAVQALLDAGRSRVVVVGPADDVAAALPPALLEEPGVGARVLVALENERFGGPAVAVAAGVTALLNAGQAPNSLVDVLACDLVHPAETIAVLDRASGVLTDASSVRDAVPLDGVLLVDDAGRDQWLASRARLAALAGALEGVKPGDPVRRALGELTWHRVVAPEGATADIDTPSDLAAYGAVVHVADGPRCV